MSTTPAIERPSPPLQPGQAAVKKKGSPLRRYLVAGVLVWLPIIATLWVVTFLFHLADKTLLLLPLPPGHAVRRPGDRGRDCVRALHLLSFCSRPL